MKPIINRLTGYTTLVFFPILLLRKRKWILPSLFVVLLVSGCFQKFYQTGTTNQVNQARIEALQASQKVFIIHYKDGKVVQASKIGMSNDSIVGITKAVDLNHFIAFNPKVGKPNKAKGSQLTYILSEVHLYVNVNSAQSPNELAIPLKDVYRMDVYEKDQAATNRSTTWSIIGIVVFVGLAVLLIAGASAVSDIGSTSTSSTGEGCNCPQIHIEKEGNFEYVNGVYSGAVYSNLEKSDILPLEAPGSMERIKIRIDNTPGEKQYINAISLIAIRHKENTKVLADRHGRYFTVLNASQPFIATDLNNKDYSTALQDADNNGYSFDKDLEKDGPSVIFLDFPKNEFQGSGKLNIRAKNTEWAATINQDYTALFGDKYPEWRKHIEKTEPSVMDKRQLEQGLPISVYVHDGKEWNFVDYFPLVGSKAYRDLVMKIDLPQNNETKYRIKLETVFNFWEIDKVTLDLSSESPIEKIPVDFEVVTNSQNPKNLLALKDDKYYQLTNDESINIEFDPVPAADQESRLSYFLQASGYYHNEDYFPGQPDYGRLEDFKKPGAFSRFSKSQFRELEQWRSWAIKSKQ